MPKKSGTHTTARPLFRQIVDELRSTIVSGKLAEHAALPSERDVAERHNVSRMTARRALKAVEAEGLAYSKDRQGRFVSPRRLNYNVSSMADFIADAAADGTEIECDLLESTETPAEKQLAKILSVPVGTPLYRCRRLFRRDKYPTFLETEIVISQKCGDAPRAATGLESDPIPPLRYSPLGHTADIVIRMRALEPEESQLLGLAPYQAGIEQEHHLRH